MSPCGKTFRSYAAAAKYAKEQSIEARCFRRLFFIVSMSLILVTGPRHSAELEGRKVASLRMIPYAIFCQAQANSKTCKAEPHGEREQARHGKQCNIISAISFLQALKILKPAPAG